MTVNSQSNKTIVLCDGATTVFDFSFIGVAAAYIGVVLTDSGGVETVLARGSAQNQFQVALNAAVVGAEWGVGGTLTYAPGGTAVPAGNTLTIFRTLPLTQAISLQNQISLAALGNGAETGLDLGVMQLQQVAEQIGRALIVAVSDPPPLPLPPVAQRANHGAAFDADGNMIAGSIPGTGVISTAMQPVVNAATLALGRTAFGLGALAVLNIGEGLQDDGAGNARVLPPLLQASTNQAIDATDHTTSYYATGALTFTLARANTLFSGFYIDVFALTAAVTFAINANDAFNGQASGVSYVIPKGCFARISTNALAAGTWFPNVSGISPKYNVRVFTSVGGIAYTPSAGLLAAIVAASGAAGGGGGVQGGLNVVVSAGGGGGGCFACSVLTAAQIGAGQTVTVGAGGTPGAGFNDGQPGAAVSFGALVVAPGGGGGGRANSGTLGSGGVGGSGGTGQILIPGGPGDPGVLGPSATFLVAAGKGGDGKLGFGGVAVTTAGASIGTAGNPGQLYGGGASGAQVANNTGGVAGGTGASGIVIVIEILAAAA